MRAIGTQRQLIMNYSLHQRKASETDAFIAHMERGKKLIEQYPSLVMGDSAYGSEENYAFLAEQQIGNYLKYNTFHLEGTKKYQTNRYRAQARTNLNSERGITLRKQRGVDLEPSIGDIKFNQGYQRCRLRGQAKVNVEIGLLSVAHNVKKIAHLSIN